jgi:hypothetical protein
MFGGSVAWDRVHISGSGCWGCATDTVLHAPGASLSQTRHAHWRLGETWCQHAAPAFGLLLPLACIACWAASIPAVWQARSSVEGVVALGGHAAPTAQHGTAQHAQQRALQWV